MPLPSATTSDPLLARVIASGVLAVALHHVAFRKGEWHLHAPLLFNTWLASHPLLFVIELVLGAKSYAIGWRNALVITGSFTTVLFSSIVTYRLFFHRLNGYPGPILARVSKLWHSAQCVNGQNHLVLDNLRRQYGDIVRTGPNELTIFKPEALVQLDGVGNHNSKSPFYDFLMPYTGLENIRDRKYHDERRRVWTQAFSTKALPIYEQKMAHQTAQFEKLIAKYAKEGTPIDFTQVSNWFAFDVMGTFALNKSFDMIHTEQWHFGVSKLRNAMQLLGPMSPVVWLGQIGLRYMKNYWVVKDWHSFQTWCGEQIRERAEIDDESTCVSSYFIADAKKRDALESEFSLLTGEAITAIVAGSDTVAFTTTYLFYELARNPSHVDILYKELQGVDYEDHRALEKLPHLNALINETLRLHPAVATGGYRDAPAEGVNVAEYFIPGGVTMVAPRYSIFRSEEAFDQPDKFIPERWYSQPEMIKDSRCFLPFSQGRYSCVGKALALSELRTVTALLVSKYEFRFADGDDGACVVRDKKDQFTGVPGDLKLIFTLRV